MSNIHLDDITPKSGSILPFLKEVEGKTFTIAKAPRILKSTQVAITFTLNPMWNNRLSIEYQSFHMLREIKALQYDRFKNKIFDLSITEEQTQRFVIHYHGIIELYNYKPKPTLHTQIRNLFKRQPFKKEKYLGNIFLKNVDHYDKWTSYMLKDNHLNEADDLCVGLLMNDHGIDVLKVPIWSEVYGKDELEDTSLYKKNKQSKWQC